MNIIRIGITIILMFAFILLIIWSFLPRNRKRFEKNGQIPFLNPENPSRGNSDE